MAADRRTTAVLDSERSDLPDLLEQFFANFGVGVSGPPSVEALEPGRLETQRGRQTDRTWIHHLGEEGNVRCVGARALDQASPQPVGPVACIDAEPPKKPVALPAVDVDVAHGDGARVPGWCLGNVVDGRIRGRLAEGSQEEIADEWGGVVDATNRRLIERRFGSSGARETMPLSTKEA